MSASLRGADYDTPFEAPYLDALEQELLHRGAKRIGGNELRFLCPAHDDRNTPNARYNTAKRAWTCDACGAGGGAKDLAERLGVDTMGQPLPPRIVTTIATYDYDDEDGNLLFQVLRKSDKRFSQRRPDGAGGWIYKLGDTRRVPYRLRQVQAAIRGKKVVVYIPEGEKDVDRLDAVGFVATTNPQGAKKWRDEYSTLLEGIHAVLLPDNDDTGIAHTINVARSLSPIAESIRILELPDLGPGGDVSDWLDAGHTPEQLAELARATPAWERGGDIEAYIASLGLSFEQRKQPKATAEASKRGRLKLVRLDTVQPRAVEFLWEPYIILGKVNNLQGEGGLGKTTIALDIAARVTTGSTMPAGGAPTEPANALYFVVEDDIADTTAPRFRAAGGDPERFFVAQATIQPTKDGEAVAALSLAHLDEIRDTLEEIRPALLVIDPVTSFLGAGVDMHRANEVRPVLEGLKALAEEYRVAILSILHVNKGGLSSAMYRALGSVDFGNVARSVLMAGRHDEKTVLTHAKVNVAPKGDSLYYEMVPSAYAVGGRFISHVQWQGPAPVSSDDIASVQRSSRDAPTITVEEAQEYILLALANGPVSGKRLDREVRDDLGASKHIFEKARSNLRKSSAAERIDFKRVGFGEAGVVWWYRMDLPEPDWETATGQHLRPILPQDNENGGGE